MAVMNDDEAVGRGFGSDVRARVVRFEQMFHERRLSSRVLPQQEDLGLGIEITLRKARGEEGAEFELLLDLLDARKVNVLEAVDDRTALGGREDLLLLLRCLGLALVVVRYDGLLRRGHRRRRRAP